MKKIITYGIFALTMASLTQSASAGPIVLKPKTDVRDAANPVPRVSPFQKYRSWSIADPQIPVNFQGCQTYGGPPSSGSRSWWYCGKFSVNGSTSYTYGESLDGKDQLANGILQSRRELWTAEFGPGCAIQNIFVKHYSGAGDAPRDLKVSIDPSHPRRALISFILFLNSPWANTEDRNYTYHFTGDVQLDGVVSCPEDMELLTQPQ